MCSSTRKTNNISTSILPLVDFIIGIVIAHTFLKIFVGPANVPVSFCAKLQVMAERGILVPPRLGKGNKKSMAPSDREELQASGSDQPRRRRLS